ncbi:hypothetical protein [Candidatus Palauibacter sp.]|uniref:hypothetical protein n=1 Tax=Candidatus Palauibacter sp. TaxID=3101350 RepID=UPI003B51C6B4
MRKQVVVTFATLALVSAGFATAPRALGAQEAVVFDSADVAGLSFQSIGPPRGGRSTAVAGITEQPLTYFMGATGGGVWRYRAGRGAEPARGCAPDAAGAALVGEGVLSETQLNWLDRLGNGNESYDLGGLLSWLARCRRGEARCGGTSVPAHESIPGAAAASGAPGRGGRRRSQEPRRSRFG